MQNQAGERERVSDAHDWMDGYFRRLQEAKTPTARYDIERALTDELFQSLLARVPEPVQAEYDAALAVLRDAEAGLADGQSKVSAHHKAPPAEAKDVEGWTRERMILDETVRVHESRVSHARARYQAAVARMREAMIRQSDAWRQQANAGMEDAEQAAALMVELATTIWQIAGAMPDRVAGWTGDAA